MKDTLTAMLHWEQINKGTGQLEDVFLETIPVDHGRLFKSCTAASWMHIGCNDQ